MQLLEEADVLDGDHGLIGEGLQQLDLVVGERAGLLPSDRDGADWSPLAQHRHPERTPSTESLAERLRILSVDTDVWDMHHGALENGAAEGGRRAGPHGEDLFQDLEAPGRGLRMCGQMQEFTVVPCDVAKVSFAQTPRALGDGLEDRLDIGRRT